MGEFLWGRFRSSPQSLTDQQQAEILLTAAGTQAVTIASATGVSSSALAAAADGVSNASAGLIGFNMPLLYNGAGWDRQRGNIDFAAMITLTAAGTGTVNSADISNYNNRGAHVVFDVTAISGGYSALLHIQGKDNASGKYYDIGLGAAVTTVTTNVYEIYPGIVAANNVTFNLVLPHIWRLQVVGTVGGTITATVGASLIV